MHQLLLLARATKSIGNVWISNPSWPNHQAILKHLGMNMASYYYFDEILRKIGHINFPPDFLFKIFELNISARKQIINECDLLDNEVSKALSKVINYEISLISSHN